MFSNYFVQNGLCKVTIANLLYKLFLKVLSNENIDGSKLASIDPTRQVSFSGPKWAPSREDA